MNRNKGQYTRTRFPTICSGEVSTTSSTNKLVGKLDKGKSTRNKAEKKGESKPNTDSSEQGSIADPKHINTPTADSFVREYFFVAHQ